ncbi:MAG: 3'(2'),5'-bisphosphate nucleotidase CysQ [Pseudomonadota bacterium]
MTIDHQLDSIISIAKAAGTAILEIYDTEFEVDQKEDDSPLTAADLASHKQIKAGLEALDSNIPVLSEESAEIPYEERKTWNRYWLVDPLDGTKEFIKRNGEFTVNIALIEDSVPVLGVVHVPVSGVTYAASEQTGAIKQQPSGEVQEITIATVGERSVRVVGSRSHASPDLAAYLEFVGEHTMVPMGSSLKLCLVAEGAADVYPRHGLTSEWDTAAAQAVVEHAGGIVSDWQGKPIRYNTKAEFLNPYFVVYGDKSRSWIP